jgi:hypothetical protein
VKFGFSIIKAFTATEFSKAVGPVAASGGWTATKRFENHLCLVTDGSRSGGLLAAQPSDAAASPRKFY